MGIVAKYKYDGSVYADLIPEFNAEFTDYTVIDEVEGNIITRTIESDELPTLMRFGRVYVEGETSSDNRTDSLLEVLDMNTSGLTSCSNMFRYNKNLTSIICEWDTSKVTNMYSMFSECYNLTSLDISNLDTNNATRMDYMFYSCNKLTSLDLSNWNTSNVTTTRSMFNKCNKLTSLDLSNFDTSEVADMSYIFNDTPLLTDIGMIYCDQSTINKVASLLPTDHNITIWVESDDILQYDQYDHITYKTQKVEDTVHLNSPLLMGDTIEVIDGKTYHVHRYEKIVLDGSEDWCHGNRDVEEKTCMFRYTPNKPCDGTHYPNYINVFGDRFANVNNDIWSTDEENLFSYKPDNVIDIRINKEKLSEVTVAEFKQWLQANPTTVIYELATPYYELISEEPLELTLLDTTDNTINNNSILPSNMTIANKELSTIAIKPSTTYTLSFDKSNEDSEVTIDICGGEQITTVLNRVELTTPSELGSGIRFISSDGCIISNVRLLEGSLVKEAIPKETFEGLQNSFDEGYIIGENLFEINEIEPPSYGGRIWTTSEMYPAGTYTFVFTGKYTSIDSRLQLGGHNTHLEGVYANGLSHYQKNIDLTTDYKKYIVSFTTTVDSYLGFRCVAAQQHIKDIILLKGDHTHLSEAELMRYIEKGTSHYEEEDFNHVGKYKVEYKVIGKNKFDVNTMTPKLRDKTELISYDNGKWILKQTGGYPGIYFNFNNIEYFKGRRCIAMCDISTTNSNSIINCQLRGVLSDGSSYYAGSDSNYLVPENAVTVQLSIIFHNRNEFLEDNIATISNIQIEEGTVATEYEPYKEDIRTYYLSSPLLKGDTIEDINGVATHVKRYGKVVLDGSEDWKVMEVNTNTLRTYISKGDIRPSNGTLGDTDRDITSIISEKFVTKTQLLQSSEYGGDNFDGESIAIRNVNSGIQLRLSLSKLNSINSDSVKQWLQVNPITVVYELASPQYETISTESILCDSYVNGHLDVDTNIPIEKVVFNRLRIPLKYQSNSTNYIVKFDSDNNGVINEVYFGGSNNPSLQNVIISKGTNILNMATGNGTIGNSIYLNGIGFNASNIQVVEANEDKEFGYFKGLQSSFESELVTDENDENYGKYKVECKIVGKNKINIASIEYKAGVRKGGLPYICKFTLKPNTNYTFSWELDYPFGSNIFSAISNENLDANTTHNQIYTKYVNGHVKAILPSFNSGNYKYLYITASSEIPDKNQVYSNFQLEEGTQATSYEPYKESIHTLYLNSPLLKGDKLVVHDGKLCHYHKMDMVVLDGSEDEYWSKAGIYIPFIVIRNVGLKPNGNMGHDSTKGKMHTNILQPNIITSTTETDNRKGIYIVGSGEYNEIRIRLTDNDTVNSVKQWLQQNPTTVVYELADPWYEPIEPQLSQYSFSTVKDGDMEIITVLPIEKINLTYRTDINGVSSIEEQIASIQEGTDISSIIDEEVDE